MSGDATRPLLDSTDSALPSSDQPLFPVPYNAAAGAAAGADEGPEIESDDGSLERDFEAGEAAPLEPLHWLQATVLIDDAVHRRVFLQGLDAESLRRFSVFVSPWTVRALRFCVILNLALALFEKPAALPLPRIVTVSLELFTLAAFVAQALYHRSFSRDRERFFHDPKHAGLLIVIGLTLLDMTLSQFLYKFRFSRLLRVYFISYNSVYVRAAMRNIRRTIPRIMDVIFLMLFFTIVCSIVFTIIFSGSPGGSEYFPNFWTGFLTMYILRTNSNYPDCMVPFYKANRLSTVAFISYLLVAMYLLTSLSLAVVYQQYQEQLKVEERRSLKRARRCLVQAFAIVAGVDGVMSRASFVRLMRSLRPHWVADKVDLAWLLLVRTDEPGPHAPTLSLLQFLTIPDVLKMRFHEMPGEGLWVHPEGRLAHQVRRVVLSKYFEWAVNAVIVGNVLLVALEVNASRNASKKHDLSTVEGRISFAFTAVYLLEALLKVFALGWSVYIADNWNKFDLGLLALNIADILISLGRTTASTSLFRFLLVFRVARLWAAVGSVERFRVLLSTLSDFLPTLSTYVSVFFMVFYVYAIVGMELFGGLIYEGAPRLVGTPFAAAGYYPLTMNDFIDAMIVLFSINVGNNWETQSGGFIAVTSQWSWLYFLSFNLIAGVIVSNIVIAFVLEAFILQWEINASGALKNASDNILAVSAAAGLSARWRAEPVRDMDYFLRRMFWEELQADGGLDDSDDEVGFDRVRGKSLGQTRARAGAAGVGAGGADPWDVGMEDVGPAGAGAAPGAAASPAPYQAL